jgi:hypothetical protein
VDAWKATIKDHKVIEWLIKSVILVSNK